MRRVEKSKGREENRAEVQGNGYARGSNDHRCKGAAEKSKSTRYTAKEMLGVNWMSEAKERRREDWHGKIKGG